MLKLYGRIVYPGGVSPYEAKKCLRNPGLFSFLCGHRAGVRLNFPREVINARPDFVQIYSVNMANALTPRNPERQLKEISIPVTVMLAEHDELFDVIRMDEFFRNCGNPNVSSRVVEGSTHLDCIFGLTDMMREHFTGLTSRAQ